jgi:hypothetical protein
MGFALAAAYGGKKGDFVAGMERSVPGGEFLVAGGDERGAKFCEFGNLRDKVGEELLDGSGVRNFQRFFGVAGNFLEATEEEDFDADGLGNGWHEENCNPRLETGLGRQPSPPRE